MSSKICPKCGNHVVFDQSKGDDAKCPVCNAQINTIEHKAQLAEFTCPSCACKLSADKNASSYTCPLCDTVINVQERIAKEEVKNQGLASVIKYEGNNETFVWKHPIEDFNLGSQLIVHESQEAIFFRDGKALDLFGAGRYTLSTQNIPLLENLYKLPTNTDEVFHSEVYFNNLTTQMGIKWGTDSKVRLFDPASGLHIEIGACGNFSLRVNDSRKLLIKLVGTASEFTQTDIIGGGYSITSVVGKFKALVMTKVKANLARTIKDNNINILEIDEYIDTISDNLRVIINETLDEYGLFMPEFFVTSVMTPDDDPNFKRLKQQFADKTLKVREEEIRKAEAEAAQGRKILEAQTEAQLKMVGAQGEAEEARKDEIIYQAKLKMSAYTISGCQTALSLLESVPGWKNADTMSEECKKIIAKLEEVKEKEAKRREQIAKRNKRLAGLGIAIGVAIAVIIAVIVIAVSVWNSSFAPILKYNKAIELMNDGEYNEAYELFAELGTYKDSIERIDDIRIINNKEKLKNAEVGDYITFGLYEQDNDLSNGKENIEWLILELKDEKALVISKYALDSKPYNT